MAIRIRKQHKQSTQFAGNKKTPRDLYDIARDNDIQTTPIDLKAICRVLNIGIRYEPLENNISGSLEHDGTRWNIIVNALHHTRRQRFTISHELAHYFLHRNSQKQYEDITFHRGKDYNQKELQADNFAGALLMPKNEFIDYVKNTSNKIDDIAEYFGTSALAVKKRADVIRNGDYEF